MGIGALFFQEIWCGANDHRMFSSRRILHRFSRLEIDVVDPAELAGKGDLFQLDETGVVLQQVSDHEDALLLAGKGNELLAFGLVQHKRLLDIDVLAGEDGFAGDGVVGFGRGGDDDTLDVSSAKNI
jgi:hypothetical protein